MLDARNLHLQSFPLNFKSQPELVSLEIKNPMTISKDDWNFIPLELEQFESRTEWNVIRAFARESRHSFREISPQTNRVISQDNVSSIYNNSSQQQP